MFKKQNYTKKLHQLIAICGTSLDPDKATCKQNKTKQKFVTIMRPLEIWGCERGKGGYVKMLKRYKILVLK